MTRDSPPIDTAPIEAGFSSSGAGFSLHEVEGESAQPARVYDYLLGGKDNYVVDRVVGDAMLKQLEGLGTMVRANRHFLKRAVRTLAREFRVDQFLDVGAGIPSTDSVLEVAQAYRPEARVVYVDNDLVVAAHIRALAGPITPGRLGLIVADATRPDTILDDPALEGTLDLHRPIALMLVSVLMYFPLDTARQIVKTLLGAMPSGSYLTISHPTADFDEDGSTARAVAAARKSGLIYMLRSRDEIATLFEGLEMVEPGLVPMLDWRPDIAPLGAHRPAESVYYWAGMARTP